MFEEYVKAKVEESYEIESIKINYRHFRLGVQYTSNCFLFIIIRDMNEM